MQVQRLSNIAYDLAEENSIDSLETENNGKHDVETGGWLDW